MMKGGFPFYLLLKRRNVFPTLKKKIQSSFIHKISNIKLYLNNNVFLRKNIALYGVFLK